MCVDKVHLEGSCPRMLIHVLVFVLFYVAEDTFQKSQKLPVYKIKTRNEMQDINHAFLLECFHQNVFIACSKFGICRSNIKRDVNVEKINVEKLIRNYPILQYVHYIIR